MQCNRNRLDYITRTLYAGPARGRIAVTARPRPDDLWPPAAATKRGGRPRTDTPARGPRWPGGATPSRPRPWPSVPRGRGRCPHRAPPGTDGGSRRRRASRPGVVTTKWKMVSDLATYHTRTCNEKENVLFSRVCAVSDGGLPLSLGARGRRRPRASPRRTSAATRAHSRRSPRMQSGTRAESYTAPRRE
jgi:hypothetical protein